MIKGIILLYAGLIICIIILAFTINKAINSYKEEYVKPDTTVVYHNGKWDTTITIKPLPSWLK